MADYDFGKTFGLTWIKMPKINLIIPEKDFKDSDWEDPSISGWLTFYCISLLLSIILYAAAVYQFPFLPTIFRVIGYSALLLPLYSLVAIVFRFRSAVVLSVGYLVIALVAGVVLLIDGLITGETQGWYAKVIGLLLVVLWLRYFSVSKLVKIRFPQAERRIFIFDWVVIIYSALLTMAVSGLMLYLAISFRFYKEKYEDLETVERVIVKDEPIASESPKKELTGAEYGRMTGYIESMLPAVNIPGVKMKGVKFRNEISLVVTYEADESKYDYEELYGKFEAYADEVRENLRVRWENGDLTVYDIQDAGIEVYLELRGKRSGYSKDIMVM